MPGSGGIASSQAKHAMVADVARHCVQARPLLTDDGTSVAGIHRAEGNRFVEVPHSGGVSPRSAPKTSERGAEHGRRGSIHADARNQSVTREMFGPSRAEAAGRRDVRQHTRPGIVRLTDAV